MASIRVQTEDTITYLGIINDNITEYKSNANKLITMIENFPYWTGSDKDTYSANASEAVETYAKLAENLEKVDEAMRKCMKRYEECFEEIKKKANLI